MPQMPDDPDIAAAIESNFGACEECGLESGPSDEDADEDHKSPHEQSKRTLTSAKSHSGLVRSNGAKARPKTAELLCNVRRKSCSKKDSVGAQNTQSVTAATPSSGKQNCNCSTPKNSQISNEADAVLGARESPQQLGYHSENNGPCGRVRFKNEGSCGPKIESPFIFFNFFPPMPFFFRSYSGQTSMLLKAK